MSNYVRIKPYDPTAGHVLKRFCYKGICFDVTKGWYLVSELIAAFLKTVNQRPGDPKSPLAFDVCTEAEAKKVDKKEAEDEEPKRPADNARPVAAKDEDAPPEPKRRGRKPKVDPAEAGSE